MSTSDRILEILEERGEPMSSMELYQELYHKSPHGKIGRNKDYVNMSRHLSKMTGFYVTREWGVCPLTEKQCFIYRRMRR